VKAKENKLVNPHLSFLTAKLNLSNIINIITTIKSHGIDKEILHEALMEMLMLHKNKIKETKVKLRLYFDITNFNNNGVRSVLFENSDLSILYAILENEFEDNDATPF
jgi:hypothetical protein